MQTRKLHLVELSDSVEDRPSTGQRIDSEDGRVFGMLQEWDLLEVGTLIDTS
jgi:hypothetical protein